MANSVERDWDHMREAAHQDQLTIVPYRTWERASLARLLVFAGLGLAASIALSGKPGHALGEWLWGALLFGGAMFILMLLASPEASLLPAMRRRAARAVEPLPATVQIIGPRALLLRGWKSDALLVAALAIAYLVNGSAGFAFLSGYPLGVAVAGVPPHLLTLWRDKASGRELYVDVRSGRRFRRKMYERGA